MCGIAGIVQVEPLWPVAQVEASLRAMAEAIAHRGPDGQGIWVASDGRVGFAHRRLSIIDLSDAGAQPMWSHDRRFVITFNGEIYNYLELRAELEREGARFAGITDTEVLIESYRHWGPAALERIDGMFACAIWDLERGELFLARDPFGEKPFYYSQNRNRLAFASELDALRVLPDFDDTVADAELSGYLCLQYFDGEATPFRGARKLLPGHYLLWRPQEPFRPQRYFRFAPAPEPSTRTIDDWADELEALLVTSLRRRMRADVPVGAFLSAGVDSSTVVALIALRLGLDITAFTIGFEGFAGSEHQEAAAIAAHLGVRHEVQLLKPEALVLADRLGAVIDEPNGDTSLLPTYLLCEFARSRVKVALSGDGADELFGGYGRYTQMLGEVRMIGTPASAGRLYYSNRILIFSEQEVMRLQAGGAPALGERMQALRAQFDRLPGDLLAAMRRTDVEHYLPGAVLAKVDRMSMRHGLEVRTPFLSIPMARFAERVPSELLVDGDQGKRLLKHLAARYLPRAWLERPKRGFGLPSYSWGGASLAETAQERLVAQRDRSSWWADPAGTAGWLKEASAHADSSAYKLWSLLHLHAFAAAKGGRAAPEFDPVRAASLAAALTRCPRPIAALVRAAPPAWRVLHPAVDRLCALWSSDEEGVTGLDWLAEPAAAPAAGGETARTVVLLTGDGCDAEMAQALARGGARHLLTFGPNGWERRDLLAPPRERPQPRAYLVFEPTEQHLRQFRAADVLRDFVEALPFRPARKEAAHLFTQPPSLLRRDTPARAWQLLGELTALARARLHERRVLARIARETATACGEVVPSHRIALVISDLNSGGAERQLCNLAVGLKARGVDVRVFTLARLHGGAGHYRYLLEEAGVPIVQGDLSERFLACASELQLRRAMELVGRLPPYVRRHVWPLYSQLCADPADAVIAYLDTPNIVAGVAALLAGVPRIVLSFRNHCPRHFGFHEHWHRRYYRLLAQSQRVRLAGNSHAGNASYAEWLGIAADTIALIRNGVDFSTVPPVGQDDCAAVRAEFGIGDAPLVLGVFRLSQEKRPALFVEVVARLRARWPSVRAIIIGEGQERAALAGEIERRGLTGVIALAGRRRDVHRFISAATIMLQTSEFEGTPNSLLEAQYLGVPVVTTPAGGAAEAVEHGVTGYVIEADAERLAAAVAELMADRERAAAFGRAGRAFVTSRFAVGRMVCEHVALLARGDAHEGKPVAEVVP